MSDGHIESDVVAMYVGVNPKEGMKSPKQARSCDIVRGGTLPTRELKKKYHCLATKMEQSAGCQNRAVKANI